MALKQKVNLNWSGDGSTPINGPIEALGDNPIVFDHTLGNDTSQARLQAIRLDGLQLLYMKSNIACTVTFRNQEAAAVGSVTLAANVPYFWVTGSGTAPMTDDVAMLNISSAAVGLLQVRGIQNAGPPEATVALTGTVTASIIESDIVTGGKTIILTLTGASWVAAGATFNAQRQAIIDGLVAATSQTNGWNNQVGPALVVTNVVRTSASVVTITLPAVGAYDIASQEVVTATVPAPATSAAQELVATPTFTIDPV